MKVRLGFVSNSSSSSYICEICGNMESGMDASPSDLGFIVCEHGHTICEDHLKEGKWNSLTESLDTKEKLVAYIKKNWNGDWQKEYLEEALDNIEKATDETFEDVREEIMQDEEHYDGLCEADCPICNMKELQSDSILAYIYKKYSIVKKDIEKEMKQRFKTLDELRKFLKEK